MDSLKRGDLVTVALHGDYGKPRPALVIQSNHFNQHRSVVVLPVTSTMTDAPLMRITINPSEQNGLSKVSQAMVDKITTVRRDKIGGTFGCIDRSKMIEVERCVAVFLGLA